MVETYEPAEDGVQTVEPVADENEPAAHGVYPVDPLAAPALAYEPAGAGVHIDTPDIDE